MHIRRGASGDEYERRVTGLEQRRGVWEKMGMYVRMQYKNVPIGNLSTRSGDLSMYIFVCTCCTIHDDD